MLKRTSIVLLSVVVVAVVALFTYTEVMAQYAGSCGFTTTKYGTVTITIDPTAPIAVTSVNDPNFILYPCYLPGTSTPCQFPYYAYAYTINQSPGSLNIPIGRIDETIPVCEKNPIQIMATVPASNQVFNPGVPDQVLNWPLGLYDNFTLAWTSSPSAGKFWVATNTGGLDLNSIALKSGSTTYFCSSGIAGPGCGLPTFVPVSRTSCATIENENICFDYGPDGCPTKVYNGDTGIELQPDPVDSSVTVFDCGDIFGNQNPNCRMCLRRVDQEGASGCSCIQIAGQPCRRQPQGCCNSYLPCTPPLTCQSVAGTTEKYCK